MNGQLREHPLAELICEISAARLSGALRLVRDHVKAVVYFELGEVVFASSNIRLHRLAEFVRRWVSVSGDVLAESQQRTLAAAGDHMPDAELAARLVAAQVLTQSQMLTLQIQQASDVLRFLLLCVDGEWNFDGRARLAENVSAIKLDASELLLESARRLPIEFVLQRLANMDEAISVNSEMPVNVVLRSTEAFVLSRVQTQLSLGELIVQCGLPDSEVRQAIYTLVLGGFLNRPHRPRALSATTAEHALLPAQDAQTINTPPARRKTDVKGSDAKRDEQSEITEMLRRTTGTANYYTALGVNRSASPGEIKAAYYALVKRFHPDRFHKDADEHLRTKIEAAFRRFSEAYETLKDEEARAAYDLKLSAQPQPVNKLSSISSGNSGDDSGAVTPSASTSSSLAEQRFQQGRAALQQNDYQSAAQSFGEAARLAPTQARYRAHYGSALARNVATRRQAEAELQAAIALDKQNASYRGMLAELYRDIGLLRRAEVEAERALSLDPHHRSARQLLDTIKSAARTRTSG